MSNGLNLLYPLSEFYAQDELALPMVAGIDGQQMPEPYKSLLVHETDMTSTLEKFHDQSMRLRVLKQHLEGDEYSRQVLLIAERDQKPAEFGAIKINLQHFSEGARQQILEGRRPLGAILNDKKIPYSSRPVAFVQVTPDVIIKSALGLGDSPLLFGRRNILMGFSERILADIFEVLPPN